MPSNKQKKSSKKIIWADPGSDNYIAFNMHAIVTKSVPGLDTFKIDWQEEIENIKHDSLGTLYEYTYEYGISFSSVSQAKKVFKNAAKVNAIIVSGRIEISWSDFINGYAKEKIQKLYDYVEQFNGSDCLAASINMELD